MAESKKKVRQPKKKAKTNVDEPVKEPAEVEEEESPEEEDLQNEENPEHVMAHVTLLGCASLRKHGRLYTKGRMFVVTGEEQINYFKMDPRFEVLVQK